MYWYINNTFFGTTKDLHEMAILPKPGKYTITVMDNLGNESKRKIDIKE
ncbi:MAG TPA: hypothetical protein ENK67_05825 [Flavobacteriia bacterium]|nr:hypothetical protein [Flavobacteriia bacterium]